LKKSNRLQSLPILFRLATMVNRVDGHCWKRKHLRSSFFWGGGSLAQFQAQRDVSWKGTWLIFTNSLQNKLGNTNPLMFQWYLMHDYCSQFRPMHELSFISWFILIPSCFCFLFVKVSPCLLTNPNAESVKLLTLHNGLILDPRNDWPIWPIIIKESWEIPNRATSKSCYSLKIIQKNTKANHFKISNPNMPKNTKKRKHNQTNHKNKSIKKTQKQQYILKKTTKNNTFRKKNYKK
jgi:hypothetical protein